MGINIAERPTGKVMVEWDIEGGYASLPGVDDIDTDEDMEEVDQEAEDRKKAMTLDVSSLFSWVRHR